MTDKVANTSDPIVSVQLSSGEWLRFRSIDEITRYLEEARRYWSFLVDGQSLPGDSMAADIFNQLTVHDDRIRSYIHTALSDPKQEPAMAGEIQNLLVNRFGSHLALRHDTPDAAFVKELAKRNVTAAAYAANFLMRNEVRQSPNNASLSMQGVVAATLYRLGLVGRLEATQSSWDSLSVKISEEHEELRRSAGQLEDQFREHDAQIRELFEAQRMQFSEAQASRDSSFELQTADHSKKLSDIEEFYKRKVQLKSAVDYLDRKAVEHKKRAFWFGVAASITGTLTATIATVVGWTVFTSENTYTPPKIAVAALLAALLFWLLRILVRNYLSNSHLRMDMQARSTFVMTYLALIAEGGAIKDDDRALIVSLVFRPITDGLVRDDAAPPGLLELLTRRSQ